MSYLLEMVGRGMLGRISGAFSKTWNGPEGSGVDATIDTLQAAAWKDPRDVTARIRLGGAYLLREDAAGARQVFQDLVAAHPSLPDARIGLACALDDLGQVEAALQHFRVAQKVDPSNAAVLFCLGYCQERMGNVAEATAYYQNAITFCPSLRNAHERLAAIHMKAERLDQAIEHYAKLCGLDADQIELHLTLANLLLRAGRHQDAIERYQHAIALEPENWAAHHDVVTAYEEAGLVREAIEHLHKIIEQQPDFADTYVRLGDLYGKIGNDAAAMSQYQKAVDISPDYLEANVRLAMQHLRSGRHLEAARWFSFALELNDRLLNAYVGLGVAQHSEGRSEEAMASFELARNIEPNSTLLFSEIARMQLKATAADEGERHLLGTEATESADAVDAPAPRPDLISQQIERHRAALATRPNHADVHYRLGLLLRNRGQIDDAVASFRRAVEINPSYVKALTKLGLALSELGRTDEAIEVFRQATDVKPDYLDLHYQLGLMFAQRQQFELSLEHFERAADGNPANLDFQANLGLALQNMGLIDRARATWDLICDLAPDSAQSRQARAELAKHKAVE